MIILLIFKLFIKLYTMKEQISYTKRGNITLHVLYVANPASIKLNYEEAKNTSYMPVEVIRIDGMDSIRCKRFWKGILEVGKPDDPNGVIYTYLSASDFLDKHYIIYK